MHRNTIVALLTGALLVGGALSPSPASAQGRRGRIIIGGGFGYGYRPYFYDPFWGPYYPDGAYPYVVVQPTGWVRVKGVPKETEVFVDGYYAGIVDDFDGVFQHLDLEPGPHRIEVRAQGYQPVAFDVRVEPGQTVTYHAPMRR